VRTDGWELPAYWRIPPFPRSYSQFYFSYCCSDQHRGICKFLLNIRVKENRLLSANKPIFIDCNSYYQPRFYKESFFQNNKMADEKNWSVVLCDHVDKNLTIISVGLFLRLKVSKPYLSWRLHHLISPSENASRKNSNLLANCCCSD